MSQLLILGLGARSTLFYQEQLHNLYFEKHGGYATFPFILKQLNFNTINPFLPDNVEVLSPILEELLTAFNFPNVHLLVPNISIHEILDTITFKLKIIHPYELLLKKLQDKKENKMIFFGTKFTHINSYISAFIREGLVEKLHDEEILFLDNLRKKIYSYNETAQEVENFNKMMLHYSQQFIVVIACTELSIINKNETPNVIDLAMLQIQESLLVIALNL